MRDLAIGVIGTGRMGADHTETISSVVARASVRAVADIDRKRAESVASRIPGARSHVRAEELIQSPDIDAIIIASDSQAHTEQALASIAPASRFSARNRSRRLSPSVKKSSGQSS